MDKKSRQIIVDLYRDLSKRLRHLQGIARSKPDYVRDADGYRIALRHFEQIIFGQKNGFDVLKEALEKDHADALEEGRRRRRKRPGRKS